MKLKLKVVGFTIDVDLVDHIHEFLLRGVLSQGSHHHTQLLGGDVAIAILVEQLEGLAELWNNKYTD